MDNLGEARPEVATIAETASLDPLTVAADRYATLRKFAPDLLETLQFRAGKGSTKTLAAIEVLRALNKTGKRDLPADAPMPFRKEWRKSWWAMAARSNGGSGRSRRWRICATSCALAMYGLNDPQHTGSSTAIYLANPRLGQWFRH
jgi:hypothetical protein